MKLFHVSEESNINKFIPRTPTREDMDKLESLVWAINERCLPNYLTPRDCPRVTYHTNEKTTHADICKFFSSSSRHCVAIENGWFERMGKTRLYLYEFDASNFEMQNEVAGYYVSKQTESPISVAIIDDLFSELFGRNVELRVLDSLWTLGDAVQKSTLNWSLCRMANAKPR